MTFLFSFIPAPDFCRNSSMVVSPAFSRSTSRRSSIGHEDHLLPPVDSKILNRDPFQDIGTAMPSSTEPYLTAKKYSSHSLPRNFSLQKVSEKQQQQQLLTPFIEDSEGGLGKKTTTTNSIEPLMLSGSSSTERCKFDSKE